MSTYINGCMNERSEKMKFDQGMGTMTTPLIPMAPTMRKFIILSLILLVPSISMAQSFLPRTQERGGKWQSTFNVFNQGSEDISSNSGTNLDFDDEWGWGFGFGYNFNNHLALGFDLNFVRPRYNATIVTDDDGDQEPDGTTNISHKADMFTGQLNLTYNILNKAITPYIEGGLGWTYVDSNVADGPGGTVCWWDPWWGYICSSTYSTYDDTRFSYGGGVGMRWDINPGVFLTGSYNVLQLDTPSQADDGLFDSWRFQIGWMF
jgi:opacity protein-like surface antigen